LFFSGVAGFGGASRAVARAMPKWTICDFLCLEGIDASL